jgi:hypothetical protein
LKKCVSNLTSPRIIGGFKATDSIQQFVSGCSPLSEGMIAYLTRLCGGNVCDRQRVHTFSDTIHSSYVPKNVADFSSDSLYHSANSPNQSIGYDFTDNQSISPTHYAIRSYPSWGVNSCHPKSWVIEVTNDRSNVNSWTEVDRRTNNEDLNSPGIVQTFRLSTPPQGEYRYIRLRQTGPNHRGDNLLGFSAFELFGQLRIRESVLI